MAAETLRIAIEQVQALLAWADIALTWLVAKAPIATGFAALVAATVAVRGYHKWQAETIGKRKIELAEEILAGFYNCREVIAWARFPGSVGGEGETRPGRSGSVETEAGQRWRDMYYWPIERLHAERDLFNGMQARKFRAMATFGRDRGKDFEDLKKRHAQIMSAAATLVRMTRADGSSEGETKRWEDIIGWCDDVDANGNVIDPFAAQVDELVTRVEAFYGGILGHSTPTVGS